MLHGKEIYLFFNIFGTKGIFGIILTSILIGIIIEQTLKLIIKYDIKTYDEFLNKLIKNKIVKNVVKNIVNIFLLLSFYIMISGFGAYFFQELKINSIIGCTVIALICFIILNKNIEGIIKASQICVPILIILILALGIKDNNNHITVEQAITNFSNHKLIIKSILYASYNSIAIIPLLITLNKNIKTRKKILIISVICAISIFILATIIFINLNTVKEAQNKELPILYVLKDTGKILNILYGINILIAMFTTAICNGYTFLENITQKTKYYKIITILICSTSVIVSKIGFSNLINNLYPFFGYLAIIQILLIFKNNLEKNKNN